MHRKIERKKEKKNMMNRNKKAKNSIDKKKIIK